MKEECADILSVGVFVKGMRMKGMMDMINEHRMIVKLKPGTLLQLGGDAREASTGDVIRRYGSALLCKIWVCVEGVEEEFLQVFYR